MERRPSKRVTIGSALALLLVAGTCIAVGIGVTTYFELVELHLEVGEASSRFEAAARGRAELAANLLRIAPHLADVDPARLDAVVPLVEAARAATLEPEAVDRPELIGAYVERQHELSRRLDDLWDGVPLPSSLAARVELAELRTKLDRSEAELHELLDLLAASLGSYERAVGGFPGSVVAGGLRFDGRPLRQASVRRSDL